MTFEEALVTEFETITELNGKVFPLNAQDAEGNPVEAPYLIYVSSEGQYDKCLDGFLNMKEVSCELNILHKTYKNMKLLSRQVVAKLKSFEGRIIGVDGPMIQELVFENDSPELYEEQPELYRKVINFRVYFKEVD